ncbi:MAG: SH3 domain-containing protein, partial [Chloroflexales bacterium]|nr:SH3 domain-containing protein [Chloroflexales bacterium]
RPTTPEAIAAEATPVVERMQAQGYTFSASEAVVWVCPDGYLHQIRLSVTGEKGGSPFSLSADLEITEPNGSVTIVAPADAVPPGPALMATVYNGGNVRAEPTVRGAVRDQINAGENVPLLAKTDNGDWYQIVTARGATGWVSATLLTIDPAVATQVLVQ